jgi:hypothetical protein
MNKNKPKLLTSKKHKVYRNSLLFLFIIVEDGKFGAMLEYQF